MTERRVSFRGPRDIAIVEYEGRAPGADEVAAADALLRHLRWHRVLVRIVADGVRQAEISATDGNHPALLGGNAYLWVETEPNTASRVYRVAAVAA